jgi:tetratricopeptide (TPR) repeat protein
VRHFIGKQFSMKKGSLISGFLVCILTNSFAQYGFDLIDSATHSFCTGDTTATIKYLKRYSDKYPDNANALLVNHRLADFIIHSGNYQSALTLLTTTLTLNPQTGFANKETDGCKLFERNDYSSAKADICVTLSNLYERPGDNKKALEYLKMADTKYLPSYGGCTNGTIMYRTYLSLMFAGFYIKTGDTTKAINRLLEYFMSGEYYSLEVAQKLKELLRFKYSQRQIEQEIEKAIVTIRHIKSFEGGETVNAYSFTLFGYTQRLPFDKLQENKKFLRKNQNLNILKG